MSLAALAELVNYSKGYLSKVENGARRATVELARRCDEALNANGELAALAEDRPRVRRAMASRPVQLPPAVTGFAGRGAALDLLDEASRANAIVVIVGAPGVGKTALTLHWAHRVIDRFPDGCLYADMQGYGPASPASPAEVIDGFLRALGAPPGAIPPSLGARSALLRSMLYSRQMLIILDNAAAPDQVRPLLPGSRGCKVVITGRSGMSGLVARDGAFRYRLESLPEDEAVALLRRALATQRSDAELIALSKIAQYCGYLPLALRIAAGRAHGRPGLKLSDLANHLAAEHGRLDMLAVADDESSAIRSVFSWSYQTFAPEMARMFRLLALHPGPYISTAAAGALAGVSPQQAGRLLEALASASVLEETTVDRYRFHDLLRLYAVDRLMAEESYHDRADAELRLLTWYLHAADTADRLLMPHRRHLNLGEAGPDCVPLDLTSYDQALEWCDAEYPNLAAITRLAAQVGEDVIAWEIPAALWSFFSLRRPWDGWIRSCKTGLASAQRISDRPGEAQMLTSLGNANADLQNFDEAAGCFRQALAIRRDIGDRQAEGSALINLGNLDVMQGRFTDAVISFNSALGIFREIGDKFREGIALNSLGEAYRALSRPVAAIGCFRTALAIMREIGDSFNEGDVMHNLADVHVGLGKHTDACRHYQKALAIRRKTGDRPGEALTLRRLGDLNSAMGRQQEAQDAWLGALAIFRDLEDPQAIELGKMVTARQQAITRG